MSLRSDMTQCASKDKKVAIFTKLDNNIPIIGKVLDVEADVVSLQEHLEVGSQNIKIVMSNIIYYRIIG